MDGILIALKPPGPTSHDIVALVRRLAATKRVGHGGTLDPFASGVLPLFLGRATKVVEYHLGDSKGYRATLCFGASSTTDDLEGDLTPSATAAPTREALDGALAGFRGEIAQRPPVFSAIKVAGRRAYAMARAGETVALAERRVTIEALEVLGWDDADPSRPVATIDVRCSAGTYIRALARDLGAAVGSAAYLGALVRTASGPFTTAQALGLDDIRAAAAEGPERLASLLLPVDAGLDALPEVAASDDDVVAIARGQFVRAPGPFGDGPIRVRDGNGTLIAIARYRDGRLAPDKVLIDAPTPAEPARA
jgi:tRNA pseudouridine55 synthase